MRAMTGTVQAWQAAIVASLLFALITLAAYLFVPVGIDWRNHFYPASLEILAGRSPYNISGIYNPPWMFIPLIPFASAGLEWGNALMFTSRLAVYLYLAHRFKLSWIAVALFLLSPAVISDNINNNLDWIVLLALLSPRWLGMLLLAMKPQTGIVLALLWIVESLRNDGLKATAKIIFPVSAAALVSLALFGLWFVNSGEIVNANWNASLFPHSIPFAAILLVSAFKHRRQDHAIYAGTLLSPYVAACSYSMTYLALARTPWMLAAAVVGGWLLVIAVRFIPS